jgi:hypothetical protein
VLNAGSEAPATPPGLANFPAFGEYFGDVQTKLPSILSLVPGFDDNPKFNLL